MSISAGNVSMAVQRPVTSTGRPSPGYLVVFFGIFLLVGAGVFYGMFVRTVLRIQAARDWTATPCTVISSKVGLHHGSKGGYTYSIDIVYSYQSDGRLHRSNRYDFMGGSSSGYNGKLAVVLHYPRGSRATCYVNPGNPTDAVIERGFTPDVLIGLFPLAFFFVGTGGMTWAFTVGRAAAAVKSRAAEAPWLQRTDWAARRILYSTEPPMKFALIFTLIWNAVSVLVLLVLLPEILKPENRLAVIGLLLPAIGIGLMFWAGRAWRRWQTFGETAFELSTLPGALGGALEGTLRLGRRIQPEGECSLRLACLNRVTTGSGKNRSTSIHILWEDEQSAGTVIGDCLPVAFFIPPDCQETNQANPNSVILWQLEFHARAAKIAETARFEVPVFRVTETPSQVAEAERVRADERRAMANYRQPPNSRIRVKESMRGGKEFTFAAARNPGAAIGVTTFLAFWSAIVWLLIHLSAPPVFPIMFGLFDVIIIMMAGSLWCKTTLITAERDSLRVTNRFLGMGRMRTVPASEVSGIAIKVGRTSGTAAFHDIQVTCRNGHKLKAGTMIKDLREAHWLAWEMSRSIGLAA